LLFWKNSFNRLVQEITTEPTRKQVIEVVNFVPEHHDDWAFTIPYNCHEVHNASIPLPRLPQVFETTVSITSVNENMTMYLTEWVDEINERIRYDGHFYNMTYEYYLDLKHVSFVESVLIDRNINTKLSENCVTAM
jgi:hypothetical protein